jgi:hypothetical protein
MGHHRDGICPDCKAARKKARQDKWYAKKYPIPYGKKIVMYDPLGRNGGLRAGMLICADEVSAMVQQKTFTPGTILRDADGTVYRIEA